MTVVRALMDQLPGYDLVYFGDTARMPYGTKSSDTVIECALENTQFLLGLGAKLVVMACNTVSSVATDAVSAKFDVPLFEVISPAVAMAVKASRNQQIGVIGTRATIGSGIYEKKIKELNSSANVYSIPCPLLVSLVEEGWRKKPETAMIVKKYLHPLKVRQIDTLILGCTHYPLLKETIHRKIGKRVTIIDSSIGVASRVKAFLDNHSDLDAELGKNGKSRIFVSDVTEQFQRTAQMTLKQRVSLERVRQ